MSVSRLNISIPLTYQYRAITPDLGLGIGMRLTLDLGIGMTLILGLGIGMRLTLDLGLGIGMILLILPFNLCYVHSCIVCYRLTQILQHHQSAALHAEMGKCMVLLKRHTEAIIQYELALR